MSDAPKRRPNPVYLVAVAASTWGVEGLRRDGIYVDEDAFDQAVRLVATLGRFFEPEVVEGLVGSVTPLGAPRNSSDDEVMTPKDVAQATGLTEHAVRKAARAGALRGSQDHAGRWTFEADAVSEWRSDE